MFGGGSSESDWTLLRRPSPEERVREKLPVPIGASSTFSKHFEGPKLQVTKILWSSSHPAPQAAAPARQACSPRSRLDTSERGLRGLEPSKMKERQSPHRWSLENTLEDGPLPARPLARPCPETRGKTLLLSIFHHPRRRTTRSRGPGRRRAADIINCVNVKCSRRRSLFVYVSNFQVHRAFSVSINAVVIITGVELNLRAEKSYYLWLCSVKCKTCQSSPT